jgi:E3 ubiquitin-protein ligase listerin
LRQLVLLNCLLDTKASGLITKIPKQRLVLFVKHSVRHLHKGKLSKQLTDEILKALSAIIPLIREVYDSFWGQMVDFINNALSPPNQVWDDDNISILHATLELLATLEKLMVDESNEDLEDAWMENEKLLIENLFGLLKECQGLFCLKILVIIMGH